MFLVTIGISDYQDAIKADLYRYMKETKIEGAEITIEDYYVNEMLYMRFGLKEKLISKLTDKGQVEEFKYILASALTEAIINNYEMKLIKKIAKTNFFYLTERERAGVTNTALQLLKGEKMMQPGGFYKATRRNKIMRSILEYLAADNEINIKGFLNFRLVSYLNELNEVIERALEIYIAEREYNEFIKLLRYFVDIQECKMEEINLCQSKDGRYILCDSQRNKINIEYFDELKSDIADDSINYDDLLISTLITISPNRIIIHEVDNFKNKELIQTITSVFEGRIILCDKCDLCGGLENKGTNNYSL